MIQSPAAWRGNRGHEKAVAQATNARQEGSAPSQGLAARAGRELVEHPAETAALVAMTVAVARLWMHRERPMTCREDGGRRRRTIAPLALMAAICLLMVASCAVGPVVEVAPDPRTFGLEYSDDFAVAGEKIAREQCTRCHRVSGGGEKAAPPLNTLLRHRSSDQLTDDLIAGLRMGHDGMPAFDFNLVAALSLVTYLETLEPAGQSDD